MNAKSAAFDVGSLHRGPSWSPQVDRAESAYRNPNGRILPPRRSPLSDLQALLTTAGCHVIQYTNLKKDIHSVKPKIWPGWTCPSSTT